MNPKVKELIESFQINIHYYPATLFNPKAEKNHLYLAQPGVDEIVRAMGASVQTEVQISEAKQNIGVFIVQAKAIVTWEEDSIQRRVEAEAIASTAEAKFQPRPYITCPVCGSRSIKFYKGTPECDRSIGSGCSLSEGQKRDLKRDVSNIESFSMISAAAALDTLVAMAAKRAKTRAIRSAACVTATFADDDSIGFDKDGTFSIQGKVSAALSLFGMPIAELIKSQHGRRDFIDAITSFYEEKGMDRSVAEQMSKAIPNYIPSTWYQEDQKPETPKWSHLKETITLYELLWLMGQNHNGS